jgi:mannosyltransferase
VNAASTAVSGRLRAPARDKGWTRLRLPDRFDPAVAALFAIALAAGFYRLGTKGLWLDEAFSANYARLGLSGLWQLSSRQDPNMSFYYLVLHFWVLVFGPGAAAVRSLSVVAGALAVPFAVLLGRRMFGSRAGLVAGLLLALNPFFLHYEQTARSYTLVVLLVLVSCWAFMAALENPSRARLGAYALVSALSVYAHYFAALVLLVQFAALLALKPPLAFRMRWAITITAVVLLCVPEAVFASRQGGQELSWIPTPSFSNLIQLPSGLAGGIVLAILLSALACYGFVRAFASNHRRPALFAAAWLLGPVLLDFIGSRLGHPLFLARYLIVVLPALLLLAAAGVAALPRKAILVACALLGVVMVSYGGAWYANPSVEGFRGATAFILKASRGGDAISYDPELRLGGPQEGVLYYESVNRTAGPRPTHLPLASTLRAEPPRLWLVMRDSDVASRHREQVERSVARRYVPIERQTRFRNLTVILYRLKSPRRST